MNRKIGWKEIAAALALGALVILAGQEGEAARYFSLILRGLGAALFLLFAYWFSRAVYFSVKAAPDYWLFGYSLLAFTLLSWGLAFLYPFPIRNWQDLLLRDIAFYAGVPAPLVLMLLLAAGKIVLVPGTWMELRNGFARGARGRRWKMALAGLLIGAFLVICAVRVWNDAFDLSSKPVVAEDTLVEYFHNLRSDDSVKFQHLGSFRLPHGAAIRSLHRGERYLVLYTPRSRLLIGLSRMPNGLPPTRDPSPRS